MSDELYKFHALCWIELVEHFRVICPSLLRLELDASHSIIHSLVQIHGMGIFILYA